MKKLKGWRTIAGNAIGGVLLIAAGWGVDVSPETQTDLLKGISAALVIFNAFMRAITTTPIGRKE